MTVPKLTSFAPAGATQSPLQVPWGAPAAWERPGAAGESRCEFRT